MPPRAVSLAEFDKGLLVKTISENNTWDRNITSHPTDRSLSDFGKSTIALAKWLEQDPALGVIEQVFIENHFHIIQSAYSSWKRRHLRKACGE